MQTVGIDYEQFRCKFKHKNLLVRLIDLSFDDKKYYWDIIKSSNLDGIVLVYDVNCPQQFDNIDKLIDKLVLKLHKHNLNHKLTILSNKTDQFDSLKAMTEHNEQIIKKISLLEFKYGI